MEHFTQTRTLPLHILNNVKVPAVLPLCIAILSMLDFAPILHVCMGGLQVTVGAQTNPRALSNKAVFQSLSHTSGFVLILMATRM